MNVMAYSLSKMSIFWNSIFLAGQKKPLSTVLFYMSNIQGKSSLTMGQKHEVSLKLKKGDTVNRRIR